MSIENKGFLDFLSNLNSFCFCHLSHIAFSRELSHLFCLIFGSNFIVNTFVGRDLKV